MAELFETIVSWPTLVIVSLVFGLLPGTVVRLAVRCYPKDDPDRAFLIGDLYGKPYIERPIFAMQVVEMSLHQGLPARWTARRRDLYSAMIRRGLLVILGGFGASLGVASLLYVGWISMWMFLVGNLVCGGYIGYGWYMRFVGRTGRRAVALAGKFGVASVRDAALARMLEAGDTDRPGIMLALDRLRAGLDEMEKVDPSVKAEYRRGFPERRRSS